MTGEVRVYPVCALEAWEARKTEDIDKWKAVRRRPAAA